MNRDLFGFAILLVLLGIGFGIYLISFIGLLLVIGALLARSRPKISRPPVPPKQPPRRISPPPVRQAEPWVSTLKQSVATSASAPTPAPEPAATPQTPTFEVPIFPNSMFPSLSPISATNPSHEITAPKPAQEDELLQIGAILALLRFAFG